MKRPLSLMLILLLVVVGLFAACVKQIDVKEIDKHVDGGSCSYKSYAGLLTVEKLELNDEGNYKLYYKFEPDSADAHERVRKPAPMLPTVTPEEVAKFGIKPGKQFKADVKYIESGACTPGPYLSEPETWQ